MRIWMHLTLNGFAAFGGFVFGALVFAQVLVWLHGGPQWVVIPVTTAAMFVFPLSGLWIGERLVRRWPARCPECRGSAFAEGHRPIRYACRDCGYVHLTRMRANWGGD